MMTFLEFTFTSFWHFIGMLIMISLVSNFLAKVWNRFWRHLNIRKHGYPPSHCDADGDFLKSNELESND